MCPGGRALARLGAPPSPPRGASRPAWLPTTAHGRAGVLREPRRPDVAPTAVAQEVGTMEIRLRALTWARVIGVAARVGVLAPRGAAAAGALTLADAIRSAWEQNPGIAASAAGVEAAREDAAAARDQRLPSISLQARGVATDEPVGAFGLKLDQARITQSDFAPSTLNSPG